MPKMSLSPNKSRILETAKIKSAEELSLLLKQLYVHVPQGVDVHGRYGRKPRLVSGRAASYLRASASVLEDLNINNSTAEQAEMNQRFGRKPRLRSGIAAS